MNFDARTAKTLPAGQFLIFDAYPGLRFEVSKKTRSWIYRYKNSANLMKQVKIGVWPAISWHAAIVEWEELRRQKEKGTDPGQALREQRAKKKTEEKQAIQIKAQQQVATYSVGMLIQDYLKGHVDSSRTPRSAKNMRRLLESVSPQFANLNAATISRKEAFDLISSYASTPVRAKTLRQELAAAWNYALDGDLIPEITPNWWQRILKGKLKSQGRKINGKNIGAQKRVLSEAEIATLVPWFPNFASQDIADILTMYLWTGTRGAEIVAIEAQEITQEDGQWWWTVPKAKTKNARHADAMDLRVPLFGRAHEIISRRLTAHPSGYLFPSRRTDTGHFSQTSVGDAVNFHQPYCKRSPRQERARLPITYWAPHDLRRTARTLLASIECPGEVAEAILGHMQPGIAGVYNLYAYDKERKIWLEKLSAKLEQIMVPGSTPESNA
jgi:integrase